MSEEKIVTENESLKPDSTSAPKIEIVDEDFFEAAEPSGQSHPEPDASFAPTSEEQTGSSEASCASSDASSTSYAASSAASGHAASQIPADDEDDASVSRRFFRSRREEAISRDRLILSRISDADLMDYLRLEQKRTDRLQEARETRNRRIMTAFMTTICLAAVVCIVYLLKDNPAILVNILYIAGLLAAFWFWKKK